jgi:hypothetical protein
MPKGKLALTKDFSELYIIREVTKQPTPFPGQMYFIEKEIAYN